MEITSIWYEYDEWDEKPDMLDGNSDVTFTLNDGSRWAATFFTYKNIDTLRKKNELSGERLGGKYFTASNMILVQSLEKETIMKTLSDIVKSGFVEAYCSRIN